MRRSHAIALSLVASLFATAAWLGCSSSSDAPAPPVDAGMDVTLDGTTTPDAGPAPDVTPPDTEAINCDNYCARVVSNCAGDASQYADLATCMKICAALPLGDAGDTGMNTVACRMYQAGAPALQSPSFSCPHAGPFGGDICGTRCGAFCLLATAQCPNAYDAGACDAACGTSFGFVADAGETPNGPDAGNTLNCRETELVQAFGDPTTNCPNIVATPTADGAAPFPCE